MIGLALVALASLFVALATAEYRWRQFALAGAFILRISVPSAVGDISVSGALPALHVSTILILSYCLVWPLALQRKEAKAQRPSLPVLSHVILGAVAIGSVLMSASNSAMGFVAGLTLNQVVAPYLFCVLLFNLTTHIYSVGERAGRLFVLLCVLESILALSVHYQIVEQPYLSTFSSLGSWVNLAGRERGTLDHPLALGLLLVAGIPLAAYLKSRAAGYVAILIMVLGISMTQSRIALVGALVGISYIVLFRSKTARQRITLLVLTLIAYVALDAAGVFDAIRDRLNRDDGSTRARMLALDLFVDNWQEFRFFGVGMDLNKEFFRLHGLRSSGESAIIGYAVGIGIPLMLLYFALIVWMIARAVRQARSLIPAAVSSILVVGSIQFYSSVTTESAAAMILWATVGIALAASAAPPRDKLVETNLAFMSPGGHVGGIRDIPSPLRGLP